MTFRSFLTGALTLLLAGAALADNIFDGSGPRVFPSQHINGFRTVIAASGEVADVYHPAPPARKRSLYTNRFPVVVMLQGARVDREYYSTFGMHLARYGFVVVIPNNTSALGPNFTEGIVMQEALDQMRTENGDPDSPVYGLVDGSKLGVSGHSFGGAAALYTITGICGFPFCDPASGFTRPPELKAAALVGTNARQLDIDSTGIPVAITTGTEDSGYADAQYTYSLLETPKALITVHGANHFGMTDIDEPPGANTDRGEAEQVVPQAISAHRYARWSGLFLRAHIYGDSRAWRKIYRQEPNEAGVSIQSQFKADNGNRARQR